MGGKKNKESLGRSLIKDRFSKNRHKKHVEDNTMLHTTEVNDGYDWGRLNLQSVTAESSLQEFLSTAELANREFTAEKLNLKYVKSVPTEVSVLESERESFLDWRRNLNDLQAKLGAALTPYERNIELWKQLWRTLEKSDINVSIIFFSAAKDSKERKISEASVSDEATKSISINDEIDSDTESARSDIDADSENEEYDVKEALMSTEQDIELFKKQIVELGAAVCNTADRFDKIQEALDKVVENLRLGDNLDIDLLDCPGLVLPAYAVAPDLLLTAVLPIDQVSVSSMPGHTRHIQSLILEDIDLLDCPGLVLPAYAVAPDLLLTAVLPIDQVSESSMPGHTRHIQSLILEDIDLLDCPGLVLPPYAVAPGLLLTAVLPIDQ
ncbi:Large subunit GTPase 1-like protein, partial [Operophtera brumata]